jgi:hypothetical protein
MGGFGQALFWTQAMAGVWMFAAVTTHGTEIYEFLRGQLFGPPARVAVAAVGPLEASCPVATLPVADLDNTLVIGGFRLDENDRVDAEQYLNPRTDKPYAVVRITGAGGNRDYTPGTYYHLPPGVTFIPAALNLNIDSFPYVSEALFFALDRLHCVAARDNGEVRVNKALLSLPRVHYWETERTVPAQGLGITGVHLQIVDTLGGKASPWDHDLVVAAAAKAHLALPAPEDYRAYVVLAKPQ